VLTKFVMCWGSDQHPLACSPNSSSRASITPRWRCTPTNNTDVNNTATTAEPPTDLLPHTGAVYKPPKNSLS
jgi:hypothetical protein